MVCFVIECAVSVEVLHTVARAFRAWQQALVQAKKAEGRSFEADVGQTD